MTGIKLICVGKMKEKFYCDAFAEYAKRLGRYCRFECVELPETRLPDDPSQAQIASALEKEAVEIKKQLASDSFVAAMCVEGKKISSEEFADLIQKCESAGKPRITFIIGGSYGMSESIKQTANIRISMSDMTFPHHLARVMLAEQIYRCYKINEGSKYHK